MTVYLSYTHFESDLSLKRSSALKILFLTEKWWKLTPKSSLFESLSYSTRIWQKSCPRWSPTNVGTYLKIFFHFSSGWTLSFLKFPAKMLTHQYHPYIPANPWLPNAAVAAVIGWWWWPADLDRAAVQLSAAVTAWMWGIREPDEELMGELQLSLTLDELPGEGLDE